MSCRRWVERKVEKPWENRTVVIFSHLYRTSFDVYTIVWRIAVSTWHVIALQDEAPETGTPTEGLVLPDLSSLLVSSAHSLAVPFILPLRVRYFNGVKKYHRNNRLHFIRPYTVNNLQAAEKRVCIIVRATLLRLYLFYWLSSAPKKKV